jgi:hypothetical protein
MKEKVMKKVLSTKLKVDEIDQFTAMAEQRGESKAGLLKSIVLDYMNASSKVDPIKSTSIPHSVAPLKDDILPDKTNQSHDLSRGTSPSPGKSLASEGLHRKALISIRHGGPTDSISLASISGSPHDSPKGSYRVDLPPPSEESLPVYQDETKGRPEASTNSSTGKGWLLILGLLVLRSKYGTSIAIRP